MLGPSLTTQRGLKVYTIATPARLRFAAVHTQLDVRRKPGKTRSDIDYSLLKPNTCIQNKAGGVWECEASKGTCSFTHTPDFPEKQPEPNITSLYRHEGKNKLAFNAESRRVRQRLLLRNFAFLLKVRLEGVQHT